MVSLMAQREPMVLLGVRALCAHCSGAECNARAGVGFAKQVPVPGEAVVADLAEKLGRSIALRRALKTYDTVSRPAFIHVAHPRH